MVASATNKRASSLFQVSGAGKISTHTARCEEAAGGRRSTCRRNQRAFRTVKQGSGPGWPGCVWTRRDPPDRRNARGQVIFIGAGGQAVLRSSSSLLLLASLYAVTQPASAQRHPDPVEQARKDQQDQAAKADPAAPATNDPDHSGFRSFKEALPPIDGQLSQPLAPIESIDAHASRARRSDAMTPTSATSAGGHRTRRRGPDARPAPAPARRLRCGAAGRRRRRRRSPIPRPSCAIPVRIEGLQAVDLEGPSARSPRSTRATARARTAR